MRFFAITFVLVFSSSCTTRLIYRISNKNPEKARIVTEDIDRFWLTIDSIDSPNYVGLLEETYFAPGTRGLRDFNRRRIEGPERLAATVRDAEAYYRFIQPYTLQVDQYRDEIQAGFLRLQELYDDARFPDVYFLIGRLTSGGTLSSKGLLIGTEMHSAAAGAPRDSLNEWLQMVLGSPEAIPAIVSHELIHYQQKYPLRFKTTLLQLAIMEGSADFVGEMICGRTINPHVHEYGLAHEADLWAEFQKEMLTENFGNWLYNGINSQGRPGDLGYFIGYQICRAYYEKVNDPAEAVKGMLEIRDFEAFLAESGYKGE